MTRLWVAVGSPAIMSEAGNHHTPWFHLQNTFGNFPSKKKKTFLFCSNVLNPPLIF